MDCYQIFLEKLKWKFTAQPFEMLTPPRDCFVERLACFSDTQALTSFYYLGQILFANGCFN